MSQRIFRFSDLLVKFLPVQTRMTTNTPFQEFKTTGDEKHDLETCIEDLIDYCIMQNWYDTSKEIDDAKSTKPGKAMARTASESDLKKAHSVVSTFKGLCILSYFEHR